MAVTLSDRGLVIDGKHVPVYSGSVHYWRLERALWPKILDRVIELGFGMVETYIPWSMHEIEPGVYDWGEIDDRKDVEAFMRLCEEKGLWLIVRPGPLINAELTDFGFPEPGCSTILLCRREPPVAPFTIDAAWGLHPPKPFPVPSYASEVFTTPWAGGSTQVVPGHQPAPGAGRMRRRGPERQRNLLPLSRSALRDRLQRRVAGVVPALPGRPIWIHRRTQRRIWREPIAAFDEVEPPRECGVDGAADLPLHLDWVAYKEHQIRWSVARIARMLRERGVHGRSDLPRHRLADDHPARCRARWKPIRISTGSA